MRYNEAERKRAEAQAKLNSATPMTDAWAAVVGAAAGSTASQVTAMALGYQDKFDWGAVGRSALSAGLTYGVSDYFNLNWTPAQTDAAKWSDLAINAMQRNLVAQGANMLVGQQQKFSWSSLAAAGISAPLTREIDREFGSINNNRQHGYVDLSGQHGQPFTWSNFGRSLTGELLKATTRQAANILTNRGGRLDWVQVVGDAFGNAVGNSIVGAMKYREAERKMAEAQQASRVSFRYPDGRTGTAFVTPGSVATVTDELTGRTMVVSADGTARPTGPGSEDLVPAASSGSNDSKPKLQYTFTDEQISEIDKLRQQGKYADAYRYISGQIDNSDTVDKDTKYWFKQATSINAGEDTRANTFIRAFTEEGLRLDNKDASPERIQLISNTIGERVLTDVAYRGGVPPLVELVKQDIRVAIERGGQTLGGWGGAFYYWDLPYGDKGETIGQLITSNPNEMYKFEYSMNKAYAAVTDRYGFLASVPDMVGAVNRNTIPVLWNMLTKEGVDSPANIRERIKPIGQVNIAPSR